MHFKLIGFLLFSVILVSCGSQSKNMTSTSEFYLRETKDLQDGLTFKRTSWYTELNMLLDIMSLEISPRDKEAMLFSRSNRDIIDKCNHFYLFMTYVLDQRRVADALVRAQLKNQGFSQVAVPELIDVVKLHPDSRAESLQLYNIYGFCSKGPRRKISIKVPNFEEMTVN